MHVEKSIESAPIDSIKLQGEITGVTIRLQCSRVQVSVNSTAPVGYGLCHNELRSIFNGGIRL